ncbi:restriction endonuclease subunit S [Burkholderia cepacia]|uniref:restriction endonuclease subunit S n=1 Tax=Burkholderia cepacia TaxID=292 RepID=UPI00158F1630|nr:restriction endonuclease subunit S [Burkholderia cepacia]
MEFLERHFDSAFATPDGIRKLRELILTLAMQGKLVPQDPKDRPASELLREIHTEKKRLVQDGKIKASKALPDIALDDVPYALPHGWEWVRLGTVGNIFNGNSINSNEKEAKFRGVEGLPYIATKDVGYGLDSLDYENGVRIPESEVQFKIAHRGAVLICAEGGSAGKKCGITEIDICFGNKLFANEPFGGIPSRFLLYLYLSKGFRSQFEKAMTGIIGGVSIAKFTELLAPLPPLREQIRIVAKIDQLMERCDVLERLHAQREEKRLAAHGAALKLLLSAQIPGDFSSAWQFFAENFNELYVVKGNVAELREAILRLAVMGKLSHQDLNDGDVASLKSLIEKERGLKKLKKTTKEFVDESPLGFSIPRSWKWVNLEDLIIFGPTNGLSPKAVDYETRVRSLTLSATTSGKFKSEFSKFIDVDVPDDSDLWLRDGDILVQRGNTLEYVGVPAVYRGESGKFIYPDLMMKLRVSTAVDTDYVYYAMSSKPCRNFLRANATGTSGTMPKINQGALRSLPIPLPPLQEQRRIVATIDHLMTLCDALEHRIDAVGRTQTALLDAVMARA